MTRRGFLWLVASVACLVSRPGRPSAIRIASPHDVPQPSRFVDYDGWIVTAADRDALVGSRGTRIEATRESRS